MSSSAHLCLPGACLSWPSAPACQAPAPSRYRRYSNQPHHASPLFGPGARRFSSARSPVWCCLSALGFSCLNWQFSGLHELFIVRYRLHSFPRQCFKGFEVSVTVVPFGGNPCNNFDIRLLFCSQSSSQGVIHDSSDSDQTSDRTSSVPGTFY